MKPTILRLVAAASAFWCVIASAQSLELTVAPSAPRFMEPVYLRIKQVPYPTLAVTQAQVSMAGNVIRVTLGGIPEIGALRANGQLLGPVVGSLHAGLGYEH
jgi:hypothetical protein